MTLAQIQLRDSCHKLEQIQFQLLTAFGPAFFLETLDQSWSILLATAYNSFVATFNSKKGIDASYSK